MTVTYWTSFSKRKNSTKQPTSGTDITAKLKDNCSIINPIFESSSMPANANYIYVSEWGRYYFVTNVVYISNTTKQFSCEVDVLASYKSQIGATVAEIAFSSSNYDIWKIDSRLPSKVLKKIQMNHDNAGLFNGSGCYVLGVSNVDAGTSVVCFYAMTQSELNSFMNEVATDTNLKTAVQNYCADVWDAIISCTWVPFSQTEIPGASAAVKVSNHTCSTTARKISNPPTRASSVTITIPWYYSDFRRNAPITTVSAWIPGYGYISLNSGDLVGMSNLKFEFMADCVTGDICCNIIDSVSSDVIQSVSYNTAVSVPLSRYTQNVQEFISQTAGFIGSSIGLMGSIPLATMNPAGVGMAAASTLASGATLALAANSRDVSIKGGVGGRAIIAHGIDVELYTFSMETEDPDAANYIAAWGRPVGRTQAISNHSGYVQCDGASVANVGTPIEKDRVNQYLNTGFFYE